MAMQISTVRRRAQRDLNFRGHRVSWGVITTTEAQEQRQDGKCIRCGAKVTIATNARMTGIAVSGDCVLPSLSARRGQP